MKTKTYERWHKCLHGIVKVIFRVHAHNIDNEPDDKDGAYIIVSNHICNADPVILGATMRKQQPHYMAKKELFKVPVIKSIIKALGAFPIDRGGADVKAIKHAIKLLEEGRCVGIFPQGHRYKGVDPKGTPIKHGAAMLSTKTQIQILPCFIKTKKRRIIPFFTRVDVIVGKPIKFEELNYNPEDKGEYARISSYIFDKVCELEAYDVKKK